MYGPVDSADCPGGIDLRTGVGVVRNVGLSAGTGRETKDEGKVLSSAEVRVPERPQEISCAASESLCCVGYGDKGDDKSARR